MAWFRAGGNLSGRDQVVTTLRRVRIRSHSRLVRGHLLGAWQRRASVQFPKGEGANRSALAAASNRYRRDLQTNTANINAVKTKMKKLPAMKCDITRSQELIGSGITKVGHASSCSFVTNICLLVPTEREVTVKRFYHAIFHRAQRHSREHTATTVAGSPPPPAPPKLRGRSPQPT